MGEEVGDRRREILGRVKEVVEKLREGKGLKGIFRPSNIGSSIVDYPLEEWEYCLDIEKDVERGRKDGFERIDVDIRLVEVVGQYVERRKLEAEVAGDLPQNPSQRDFYLKKAWEVPEDVFTQVQIAGLDARETRELAVTSDFVRETLKKNVPPFFMLGVQSIKAVEGGSLANEDDPNTEAVGRFVPKFDEKGELIAADIEIFHEVFAQEGVG